MSAHSTLPNIDGFQLLEKLGQGGMGTVYKARQISMDRMVAVKILPPAFGKNQEYRARFLREARLAGRLNHVNVVSAISVGNQDEYHYIAMEFVDGQTLRSMLEKGGPIPEQEALQIMLQVVRGLKCAHENDLVHRDVKPDNIMMDNRGVVKLADLGLACTVEEDSSLTQTGTAMGTPHYASPEQARGDDGIDHRSDFYSLGATLYHMVTGCTPFKGDSGPVIMAKHILEEPIPPDKRRPELNLSPGLCALIAGLMEKNRENRPVCADELLEDIEKVLQGEMPRGRMGKGRGTARHAFVGSPLRSQQRGTGPQIPLAGPSRNAGDRFYRGGTQSHGTRRASSTDGASSPGPTNRSALVLGGAAAAAILFGSLSLLSGNNEPPPNLRKSREGARSSVPIARITNPLPDANAHADTRTAPLPFRKPPEQSTSIRAPHGTSHGTSNSGTQKPPVDPRLEQAQMKLREADTFASSHPDRLQDQLDRYENVAREFEGTPPARKAMALYFEKKLALMENDQSDLDRFAREAQMRANEAWVKDEASPADAVEPSKGSEPAWQTAYDALQNDLAETLGRRQFQKAQALLDDAIQNAQPVEHKQRLEADRGDIQRINALLDRAAANIPLCKGKQINIPGGTGKLEPGKVVKGEGETIFVEIKNGAIGLNLRKDLPAAEVLNIFSADTGMSNQDADLARAAFLLGVRDLPGAERIINALPENEGRRYREMLALLKSRDATKAMNDQAEVVFRRLQVEAQATRIHNPEGLAHRLDEFSRQYAATTVFAENEKQVRAFMVRAQEATGRPVDDMVVINEGAFLYGPDRVQREIPTYSIDRHEVSNREYQMFLKYLFADGDDEASHKRLDAIRPEQGPKLVLSYIPRYLPEYEEYLTSRTEQLRQHRESLMKQDRVEPGNPKEKEAYRRRMAELRQEFEKTSYLGKKFQEQRMEWEQSKSEWLSWQKVAGQPDVPVTDVPWFAAYAFAKWLGKRLPSADEWEKAARGPQGWNFPKGTWNGEKPMPIYNGSDKTDEFRGDGFKYLAPVHSMPQGASVYGCLHMSGNVWEWIQIPGQCRGGSWNRCYDQLNLDCGSEETRRDVWFRDNEHGFRCVREKGG